MNIYQYLYSTYGESWNIKNFHIVELENECMLVGSIELYINNRCVVGSATVYKDFTLDVTGELQAKCINNALIIYNSKPSQYTDKQINRVNEFKKKHNIDSDDKFNSYVNAWKSGMTKANLNPENIDNFLDFMNKLEVE